MSEKHFYFITRSDVDNDEHLPSRGELLRTACENNQVEFIEINADQVSVSDLPQRDGSDLLYRSASGDRAVAIERTLTTADTATFRKDWNSTFSSRGGSHFQNAKAGVPIIPTVAVSPISRDDLIKAAEELDGFPLIVKVVAGSKGVGVIRVDSMQSLRSLCDYLTDQNVKFILRKYIDHSYYARLIVVGDRVVASNKTFAPESDFRTNTGDNNDDNRHSHVFSNEIQNIAVTAVHSIGFEFGGVDILFDPEDSPYVAEVNFPCQFNYAQYITGIDVADAMIKHLLSKVS